MLLNEDVNKFSGAWTGSCVGYPKLLTKAHEESHRVCQANAALNKRAVTFHKLQNTTATSAIAEGAHPL